MEASSVMHQVMNSHSHSHSHPLEEVLSCAKQTQQQIMSGQHSPTDQQQMQMQQQDASDQSKRLKPQPEQALRCPRCDSTNTKFCYYNNYSLSQPRYFCKGCRRYWTQGGTLRNVPVGGGCRKKRPSSTASSAAAAMAAKMNKIQVVASASQVDRHHSSSSPVPTPDPGASPLHLSHSAPPSSLGYDPGDLSLAFARLQQKTQQVDDNNAAAFLHLLPGGAGGCGTAAAAGGNGFLDFLRSGSGFLDGNGAFCNSYGTGFSGSGLMLGGGSGDSDSPFLPMGEVASNAATAPTPSVVKQEACSRGVLDGGDAKGIMAMMGFHHQWAPHHQQLTMQQPFYALVGGGPGNGAAVGSAAAANAAGYDAGFGSGLGASAMDYWSNLGPAVSWHGLVNSSLM